MADTVRLGSLCLSCAQIHDCPLAHGRPCVYDRLDQLRADIAAMTERAEKAERYYQLTVEQMQAAGDDANKARAQRDAQWERAEKAERENRVLIRMVEMSTGYIPVSFIPAITKDGVISRLRKIAEAELAEEGDHA